MARPIIVNFPQADSTYLLNDGSGGASSSIPLSIPYPVVFPGIARPLTFTSTGDNSGVSFTVFGMDQYGALVAEVITGPDDDTVTTVNSYGEVTQIEASAAYTGLSIGTASTGYIRWIPLNTDAPTQSFNLSLQVVVTGTIEYSLFQTLDNLGYYHTFPATSTYVLPVTVDLVDNPIATTNGSGVVVVTTPSTAGLVNDTPIQITGATTYEGITAAELNILSQLTVLSPTTFSYNSTGTATGTGAGGGGDFVSYTYPPYPTQFAITGALTDATTNEFYSIDYIIRMIGGQIISSSAGGSLRLTIIQGGI
jgi:hypothetical protein